MDCKDRGCEDKGLDMSTEEQNEMINLGEFIQQSGNTAAEVLNFGFHSLGTIVDGAGAITGSRRVKALGKMIHNSGDWANLTLATTGSITDETTNAAIDRVSQALNSTGEIANLRDINLGFIPTTNQMTLSEIGPTKESLNEKTLSIVNDFTQFIHDLQLQYCQETQENEILDIIKSELKLLANVDQVRWENFLSLRHLANGGTKAVMRASGHMVETSLWGKAALGFLEGVMENPID